MAHALLRSVARDYRSPPRGRCAETGVSALVANDGKVALEIRLGSATIDLSLLIGWLGLLTGTAGVIASLVTYRRAAEKAPKPVYVVTGRPLARSHPQRGIGVTYNGKAIDAVHQMFIAFWNAGQGPMRQEDIPPHEPITFTLPDGVTVLDARLAKISNDATRFSVTSRDDRTIEMGFHHLDANEGALVELLHDKGFAIPKVTGKVIGARGPIEEIDTPLWNDPGAHRSPFVLSWVCGAVSVILGSAAVLTGWLSIAVWALVAGVLALLSFVGARSSYRKDVRFIPEAIRPHPYNILRMFRSRAVQADDPAMKGS